MFNASELYPIPTAFADQSDAALLDTVFGLTVTFINPAVPFCYPAEQMDGIVLDVKTSPRGRRQLLVKADKLNLAKWIDLNAVQFLATKTAEAA